MTGTAPSHDPVEDMMVAVLKAALIVVLILVALPLLVPVAAAGLMGPVVATRARFWIARPWLAATAVCGAAVVAALLVVECCLAVEWLRHATAGVGSSVWRLAPALVSVGWPFLVANLVSGVLLLPAMFLVQRHRIARIVQARRVDDVVLQERIESARGRAAAWSASRRMGVAVDVRTGQVAGARRPMTAPYPVSGRWAFGLLAAPTVRTFREGFVDARRVRDWVEARSGAVVLPADASAARALVVAESGTGKTVLLNDLVGCALAAGWPVFVIDAKGDPTDADDIVAQARAAGRSAAVGARWNLFAGTAEQVTEKLMRLLPPADGANQHYLDEARGVLGMIQALSPIRSVAELWNRLERPTPHLRDESDRHAVDAVVESRSGLTAAARVQQALMPALRPLEEWTDAAGWSYAAPTADLTVMSLSPVDVTQARLGHLLMVDLRHFLASRLRAGDKSPVLVIVDEFPQLVTAESDPGDAAAALLETARSAGAGLILAAQSTAGLSNDDTRRARALASGAALIVGRSKDPDLIVRYAGTVMRLEANGKASGDELGSGRAQHSYLIPPQDVREAWDGSFWLIQGGAVAPFRTMPPRRTSPVPTHAASVLLPPAVAAVVDVPVEQPPRLARRPMTRTTPPPTFVPPRHPDGVGSAAATTTAVKHSAAMRAEDERVTGFEVVLARARTGSWEAVAYAATDQLVLDDLEPDRVVLPALDEHSVEASWAEDWSPDRPAPWHDGRRTVPDAWLPALDELVERVRARYGI